MLNILEGFSEVSPKSTQISGDAEKMILFSHSKVHQWSVRCIAHFVGKRSIQDQRLASAMFLAGICFAECNPEIAREVHRLICQRSPETPQLMAELACKELL